MNMNGRSFGDVFVVVSQRGEVSSTDDQVYLSREEAETAKTEFENLPPIMGKRPLAKVVTLEEFIWGVREDARGKGYDEGCRAESGW